MRYAAETSVATPGLEVADAPEISEAPRLRAKYWLSDASVVRELLRWAGSPEAAAVAGSRLACCRTADFAAALLCGRVRAVQL